MNNKTKSNKGYDDGHFKFNAIQHVHLYMYMATATTITNTYMYMYNAATCTCNTRIINACNVNNLHNYMYVQLFYGSTLNVHVPVSHLENKSLMTVPSHTLTIHHYPLYA